MTLPILPRDANGKATIPFGLATMVRTSGAWLPETGQAYRANVPRIAANRIPYFSWTPRVITTHLDTEAEILYDTGSPNFLTLEGDLSSTHPDFTVLNLGTSFQGKTIHAYRLGPASRKHFVVVGIIHGDEHDGIKGAFSGIKAIADDPEFGPFRDEWTILFVPCLNPDGYKLNTHHSANVGPNSQTIDLDRNFNWFWSDYTESATESKGASAASELEVQRLLNYFSTGNSGGPVTVGFLLDLHANRHENSRYQTVEQIHRDIASGPISGALAVPTSYLTQYIGLYAWRIHQVIDTFRIREESVPREMHVGYKRSSYLPSLRGYISSLGVPVLGIEELSVSTAGGRETYKTASDFRCDYIIACAAAVTAAFWSLQNGVLIEKAAINLLSNADFNDLTGISGPQNFTDFGALSPLNDADSAFQKKAPSVDLTASLSTVLPQGEEYLSSAPVAAMLLAVLNPSTNKLFRITADIAAASEVFTLTGHLWNKGAATIYGGSGSVHILGGQNLGGTISNDATKIAGVSTGSYVESSVGNISTTRAFSGYCDNFLAAPLAANIRGYLVGGLQNGGGFLSSMGQWNPTTNTWTASAVNLASACRGPCAVYFPPDGKVYVFGGITTTPTYLSTVQAWNPVLDSIVTKTATLPSGRGFMAGSYSAADQMIYLFGGEDGSGMRSEVLKYDPVTDTLTTVSANANPVPEELETDNTAFWTSKIGRWTASAFQEEDGGYRIFLAGGRTVDSVGALSAAFYIYDPHSNAIGSLNTNNYGVIKYSTVVNDTSYTTVVSDNFGGGILPANWTDPASAWTTDSGFAIAVAATSGPLITAPVITVPMNTLSALIAVANTGTSPDCGMTARAVYSGATLTDGYRLRYSNDNVNQIWRLERLNSSVVTLLATLDVTADGSRQVTTSFKTLTFVVEDRAPVSLVATIDGLSLFSTLDFDSGRIATTGKMALFGGSP